MDRYIVREPRAGAECLQGNQIIAFPTSTAANIMIPETYYTPYGAEFQNVPEGRYMPQKSYPGNMMQSPNQMMSGIDPTYLASYSNNNAQAQYIATGHQQMHREMQMERQMQFRSDPPFGSDYQNRSLVHAGKNCTTPVRTVSYEPRQLQSNTLRVNNYENKPRVQNRSQSPPHIPNEPRQLQSNTPRVNNYENKPRVQNRSQSPPHIPNVPLKKPNETETPKNELQSQVLTRSDKLKMLYKNGPMAFTGPVEKVLKWHKALQDIGVLIIYEIVAKCVNIQPGKSCSKNLVIRDDNGPAMQVVYYEIDFLLPELKPPCTVRVIGRMMPGTCRLQAFSVRPATGDDMATLPRRAAVATHQVNKMCKEFGPTADKV